MRTTLKTGVTTNPEISFKPVFVFGSNQSGFHGKGAALHAKEVWGAEQGIGEGHRGQSYALPTKDYVLRTRSLEDIEQSIIKFLAYARVHSFGNHNLMFCVTPIGTGLAGYSKKEIASLFRGKEIPPNVVFTKEWFE